MNRTGKVLADCTADCLLAILFKKEALKIGQFETLFFSFIAVEKKASEGVSFLSLLLFSGHLLYHRRAD